MMLFRNIFMYPTTYLGYLRNKILFDNIPSSISKFVKLLLDVDKDAGAKLE